MYGLSTRNVEKLIKLVLEKLAGIECDRLLKSTFSKYMLDTWTSRTSIDCEEDLVLAPDGKGKKDHLQVSILQKVMTSSMF